MKLMGYERADFTAADGTKVCGSNIYVAHEVLANKGKGMAVERYYMTDAKLTKYGIDLAGMFGKNVTVLFNRYGKAEQIVLV